MADSSLNEAERQAVRSINTRIFFDDVTYTGNGDHYFRVGLNALALIEQAMSAAGIRAVGNVLDLPSGSGRVLRFLVPRFPNATFIACDLHRVEADFCADTFGAVADYSKPDLAQVNFPVKFELIWCGSLATHLDASATRNLMQLFSRNLAPGGLAVFTTHGEEVVRRMKQQEFDYGIPEQQLPALINSYRDTGYGYADYPGVGGYGVSLSTPDWVRASAREIGGLKEVFFRAHGWDKHQDVFGFVKQD